MNQKFAILSAALIAVAGCSRTKVESAAGEVGSAVPANASRITTGTEITAKMNQSLGTGTNENHVGDRFSATVVDAVIARNGQTAIPAGSMIYGHITGLDRPGNITQEGVIRLDFDRIEVRGKSHAFNASIDDVDMPGGVSPTLKKAGIGAAAGAALGAILSGGHLAAVVAGGALGAAAGTVVSLGVDKDAARLPEGSKLKLRATQNVDLK